MPERTDAFLGEDEDFACAEPFPPWPYIAQDEIDAVVRVLDSGKVNYWTGEEGTAFEREFADYIGMPYGIALSNGTVALELALYAFGIGEGDEVIVPSRTFIATASSVVMRGAKPVVVDIEYPSQGIDTAAVEKAITPRTRAIIAVHLGGWPCAIEDIVDLARVHGLKVIEDCAQAHGAEYRGQRVGSFGDAAAFSFCQDKIMSTGGEGGMLLLRDEAAWQRAWSFKDHGKDYDLTFHHQHHAGHRWLHTTFGTNWRMTEMQAAIGRLQLKKLPLWLKRRRSNAKFLSQGISPISGIDVPIPPPNIMPSYYRFYAFLVPDRLKTGWNQDEIVNAINKEGIPCFHGSCSEIYREGAFATWRGTYQERLSVAHDLGKRSLAFLVHPTLGESEMSGTVRAVKKVMKIASQHSVKG